MPASTTPLLEIADENVAAFLLADYRNRLGEVLQAIEEETDPPERSDEARSELASVVAFAVNAADELAEISSMAERLKAAALERYRDAEPTRWVPVAAYLQTSLEQVEELAVR